MYHPDFLCIGGVDALVAPPIAENTHHCWDTDPVGEIGAEVPLPIFPASVGVTEVPQEYRTVARQSAQLETRPQLAAQRQDASPLNGGTFSARGWLETSARHCSSPDTLRSTGGLRTWSVSPPPFQC